MVYSWILLHLENTATDIHHDASGLITAAICMFGEKLWTVFLPRDPSATQEEQNERMLEAIVAIGKKHFRKAQKIIQESFRPICFVLRPGDIL
jgi:hypothetical protein